MRVAIHDANILIDIIILTGDRKMRKVVETHGIEVHGILWLFDQMVSSCSLQRQDAAIKLHQLKTMNHRLPIMDIDTRISMWSE